MKFVVFCLFAVWCSSLAGTSSADPSKKLKEVLVKLAAVRKILKNTEKMLNTPPQNVEDCCCLSTLKCFQMNMNVQFNVTESKQKQLYKSLKHINTERALCNSTTADVPATCQDCFSHPKENATEFFNRLESLIQKGITRLTMN